MLLGVGGVFGAAAIDYVVRTAADAYEPGSSEEFGNDETSSEIGDETVSDNDTAGERT